MRDYRTKNRMPMLGRRHWTENRKIQGRSVVSWRKNQENKGRVVRVVIGSLGGEKLERQGEKVMVGPLVSKR